MNPYINLTVGTRIHYTGDMANVSGNGTITAIRPANRWAGHSYDIQLDDEDRKPILGISPAQFMPSPGRRFWLETEYLADRAAKIEQMRKDHEAYLARRAA